VLLLLHGFGGSIDQHTALAEQLCDHFEVHAIDSLGFGGSEKPPLSYNQYLWSDQAVEYLEDLARARNLTAVPMEVVLAGNSIGGYTAATAAAAIATRMREQRALSAPPLLNCTGLVLFNTAGVIRNNTGVMQEPAQFPPYQGLPSGVLGVAGSALTSLLRARIGPTCSWLYATEPEYPLRNGLVGQIYRDSCDPGAAGLFAAGGECAVLLSSVTLV
jgi:pimeloyl-ACP methyl ester carboxylesterase